MARANIIAHDLDHPVYDCLYLALAERRSARLVTADEHFVERCRGTPFATMLISLEEAVRHG